MNHARSIGTALLLVAAFGLPLACGSKPAANASFSLNGDAGTTPNSGAPSCQPGQPCPAPAPTCQPGQACPPPAGSTAPLGSVYTTDPNALAGLIAAAAAAGSAWLGPAASMADPSEAGLRAAAAQYAQGMSPDGQVAKANLAEGGHSGFIINMDGSHCYTVVAYGAGVADLDVTLFAPPLYNIVAGQDGMAGPTAVIGASPRPMCPIVPLSVPYKVDLFAKHGGGPVAAQVYMKAR